MILKSLTLEGIRSYRTKTEISLPLGTTLFEGDIASGKSTILYAIEFALFGLGPLGGSFLLRNGQAEGRVSLLFEVEGNEYLVHRILQRKGKGVQQADCYLKGPEGKEPLSATELRERILQLLRFNEPPSPRAQSVIYRYAVFTPQEEMKEVIVKEADERLQTLRRAFGVEQYKTAAQNSVTVATAIKGRIEYLRGATEDIEKVKERLAQETQNAESLAAGIGPLREREEQLRLESDQKKSALKRLESSREKVGRAEERVPLVEAALGSKVEERDRLERENEKAKRKAADLSDQVARLSALKRPTPESKDELKKELRRKRASKEEAEGLVSRLAERVENFESILKTKVCPVCEREIEHSDFSVRTRHLKAERAKQEENAKVLADEIDRLELLVDELGEFESGQAQLKDLALEIDELEDRTHENDGVLGRLGVAIVDLEGQLRSAKEEATSLKGILGEIEGLEDDIRELDEKSAKVDRELAGIQARIRDSSEAKARLEEDLRKMEQQVRVRDSLGERRNWIVDYLTPAIENIERQVLTSLNQRFNSQFQRWFQILMDDPYLQVRVDEEFSPVIEREGYEQDFLALSGGEKTTVALAYRLALSSVVQEVGVGGATKLLILDEPTDGFSKEQLSKVRDVLTELKYPQVILVSHERELEAFADQVYRVERVNGVSRIVRSE